MPWSRSVQTRPAGGFLARLLGWEAGSELVCEVGVGIHGVCSLPLQRIQKTQAEERN